MQQLAACLAGQLAHGVAHGLELHAIKGSEVIFVLKQEIHVAAVHPVVDRRLDVKDV